MKKEDLDTFEKINTQLNGIYQEVTALSKKSPNDAINKFKLKFVNKTICDANLFLKEKYRPFNDFEAFNEDEIPSNSDVALIISQYLNCMELLRSDNITYEESYNGRTEWYWVFNDKKSSIKTAPPKNLKENK